MKAGENTRIHGSSNALAPAANVPLASKGRKRKATEDAPAASNKAGEASQKQAARLRVTRQNIAKYTAEEYVQIDVQTLLQGKAALEAGGFDALAALHRPFCDRDDNVKAGKKAKLRPRLDIDLTVARHLPELHLSALHDCVKEMLWMVAKSLPEGTLVGDQTPHSFAQGIWSITPKAAQPTDVASMPGEANFVEKAEEQPRDYFGHGFVFGVSDGDLTPKGEYDFAMHSNVYAITNDTAASDAYGSWNMSDELHRLLAEVDTLPPPFLTEESVPFEQHHPVAVNVAPLSTAAQQPICVRWEDLMIKHEDA